MSTTKQWTDAHTTAFEGLKAALTSAPVLLPFDPNAQSVVVTDASNFAVSTTLLQIVNGMPIEIHTNHESLKYIQTQPTDTLSPRLARWQEHLSQYNFTKRLRLHIKGKDNVVADALSRRPDLAPLLQGDFCASLWSIANLVSTSSTTLADIITSQGTDPFCQQMANALRNFSYPRDPIHMHFALSPSNALVWTAKGLERIIVPPAHRAALLSEAHDSPISAHRGIEKMFNALSKIYYWQSMYKDMHKYCTTCDSCSSNKPRNYSPLGPAHLVAIPYLPCTSVGIDFVGPLPMSRICNNFMMTFTDYLSRTFRTVPIQCNAMETFPAQALTQAYFTQIFRYHGLPSAVHTDRGSIFTS
eukprot:3217286-Rhodomonas_salina.1